jgi:UDP-2,4-diacetamido-2,4,6-trideoxy-beta-L-altropyranose hydrolase
MRDCGTLLLRVDAGPTIGTGHLMRCLALAEVWLQMGGQATFLTAECTASLFPRIRGSGAADRRIEVEPGSVEDAAETLRAVEQSGASWVVLDGYRFSAEFQRVVRQESTGLLVVDDSGHAEHYSADLVLNQNLHARTEFYASREPYTRLLLGTDYVLIRDEFRRCSRAAGEHPELASRLLVTLGGADRCNYTEKILRALRSLPLAFEVVAVLGGSNPHVHALQREFADCGWIRLVQNTRDMPGLMRGANLAICSGGSTVWELAYLGVPTIVGSTVPVEEVLASGLQALGLFAQLGRLNTATEEEIAGMVATAIRDRGWREEMSRRGMSVIDGHGTHRVCRAMLEGPNV